MDSLYKFEKSDTESSEVILRILKAHETVSEKAEFLKNIPRKIQDKNIFTNVLKVEKFLDKTLREHFRFEETAVFPVLLKNIPDPDLKNRIEQLISEHRTIVGLIDEIQQLIDDHVFPFPGTVIEKTNGLLNQVADLVVAHADGEDETIIPTIKKHLQLFS